jgi:hypothetical protein
LTRLAFDFLLSAVEAGLGKALARPHSFGQTPVRIDGLAIYLSRDTMPPFINIEFPLAGHFFGSQERLVRCLYIGGPIVTSHWMVCGAGGAMVLTVVWPVGRIWNVRRVTIHSIRLRTLDNSLAPISI